MTLCKLFAILFTFNVAALNAQSTTTTDSSSATDNTISQQEPMDKPAGLPKVEWNILQIEPAVRENLCQRQVAYCSNNCGGPNEAVKNFCNATSMAWNCGCSRKTAGFTPFMWPVIQAECSGKLQDCQMMCNADTTRSSTCATTCNAYYQCGTDRAPPSYLQTERPNDTPGYDGPPKTLNAASNNNTSSGNSSDSSNTKSSNSNSAFASNSKSVYLLVPFVSTVAATMMISYLLR